MSSSHPVLADTAILASQATEQGALCREPGPGLCVNTLLNLTSVEANAVTRLVVEQWSDRWRQHKRMRSVALPLRR